MVDKDKMENYFREISEDNKQENRESKLAEAWEKLAQAEQQIGKDALCIAVEQRIAKMIAAKEVAPHPDNHQRFEVTPRSDIWNDYLRDLALPKNAEEYKKMYLGTFSAE